MKKTSIVTLLTFAGFFAFFAGCEMYGEDYYPVPQGVDGGPPVRTVSDIDFRPDAGSDSRSDATDGGGND